MPITSELVIFGNDLIKYDNIDINQGIIYFFFLINKAPIRETNSNIPSYNTLLLRNIGLRSEPIEISFFVGNYTTFKVTLRITNEIKEENKKINKENKEDKEANESKDNEEIKDNIEKKSLTLSKILDSCSHINFKEKINLFSSWNKSISEQPKCILNNKKETPKAGFEDIKLHSSSQIHLSSNEYDNFLNDDIEDKSKTFWKKHSIPVSEQHVKSLFEIDEDFEQNEHFLKGVDYDTYLSKLNSEKKKEYEDRETFCKGFFIASFPKKNGQVIENSQSFPAPCGHEECSSLPAMQPEILSRYPLQDTKTFELNNLAATICFPTGIKVCYSEENPPMLNDYVTPITTEKGERCYMVTYHFYYKIMNDIYSKLYEMHPLKHHLMKFADSYLSLSEEEMNQNVMKEIQKSLEKSQELGFRDYVYVPYCICLISKYPYINEMKKCLQSIYTMIVNNTKNNNLELNNLIMHLIHSVPIPERETRVRFFIPHFSKSIKLICPKMQDISVINTNLSYLLKYFNIDYLIIILRLMLFEKRILFIDDDYTRLSLVIDNFLSLIYPFYWPHPYIPIMSDQMLQMLLSFIPYINGIHSSFIPLVKKLFEDNEIENEEEVYMIYISQSKFRLGSSLINDNKKKYKYLQEHVPTLPTNLEKELKNKLKKIKDELDSYLKSNENKNNIDLSEFDLRIKNSFIEIYVQMFHDYYKYMTFLDDDVVFNKILFLEKISNNNDKKFYNEFIDTQLFQQFCQNIVKDELKYFTTMANNYNPNKKDSLSSSLTSSLSKSFSFKRTITNKIKLDKVYIIKPEYLNIIDEDNEIILKKMEEKYKIPEKVDEDGMIISQKRIITEFEKIKDENYKKSNCYIYTLPEGQQSKKDNPIGKYDSNDLSKENLFFKAIKNLKLKTNINFEIKKKDEYGITEKEKDSIKETIKDFSVNIFTSKDIKDDPIFKKQLQNTLNTPFGREFFVGILSKNVTNIILLKPNSFQLLGTLIYNSLLYILNINETNKLLEQTVILIKSTKYYGKEIKGKTTTLWNEYKSKIQGYSKVNQNNFWENWYNIEIKNNNKLKKYDIILTLNDTMLELELDKSFIKNTLQSLAEKEFGKESGYFTNITEDILGKLKKSKYLTTKATFMK